MVKTTNLEKKAIDKRNVERVAFIKDKFDLLKKISNYVNSYEWLKHKDYRDMIKDFCVSGFDYNALNEKYALSYDKAKSTISYANKKLREKIGADTLDLIDQGEIATARKKFYVFSGKANIKDIIIPDAFALLPQPDFKPINLNSTEAQQAFDFIKTYSMAEMKRRFSTIDKNALRYVLYVATGQSTKQIDKFEEYIDELFLIDN